MKKIITALLNETVNNKLRIYKNIQVIMNDIQYQEGIIEALEINPEIEFIILSELLPGEFELKELIEKIKQIKKEIQIIIILEKENKELENYLLAKGNIKIFYNNEIEIKEIVELINNKNKKEELELEIKKLKEIILDKQENDKTILKKEIKNKNEKLKEKNKTSITEAEKKVIENEIENEYIKNKKYKNRIMETIKKIFIKKKTNNKSKLIIISGVSGVGKSIFTINLIKAIEKEKKKILIIDFDFINNSIETLLGITKSINQDNNKIKNENIIENINDWEYINKLSSVTNKSNITNNLNNKYKIKETENKIKNITIKVNSNIDLISNINKVFNKNNKEDLEVLNIIKELKTKYNFIIIDTDSNNNNYLKSIIKEIHKIIIITEPNILQIKKSKNFLENNIKELNIEKEKVHILFNKVKNDSLSFNILKEVFKEYNIIGKINFINNCDNLINQNMNNLFLEKKLKEQYKKIAKKINENNNIDKYYINKIDIKKF